MKAIILLKLDKIKPLARDVFFDISVCSQSGFNNSLLVYTTDATCILEKYDFVVYSYVFSYLF